MYESQVQDKGGVMHDVVFHKSSLTDAQGQVKGLIGVIVDVTKQKKAEVLEQQMNGFLNANLDLLCIADMNGKFIRVNKRFEEILGYSTEDLEGKEFQQLIHEDDLNATREVMNDLAKQKSITAFINRYRCKDGSYRFLEWHAQPGEQNLIYASARDVSNKILQENKLKSLATVDFLTGLSNRNQLDLVADAEIRASETKETPLSMIILDIDHFKGINDQWGHPVGDEALRHVARILMATVRRSDHPFRIGGEEFLILLPNTSLDGAMIVAEKIRGVIEKNLFPLLGNLTASLGVGERMTNEAFADWHRCTDEALYRAKEKGRNQVVSAPERRKRMLSDFTPVVWKEEWTSGNEAIDRQHQEFIDLANSLIVLLQSGSDFQIMKDQIDHMVEHMLQHFHFEEQLLRRLGYPNLDWHSFHHQNLASKSIAVTSSFNQSDTSKIECISFFLDEFILGHMLRDDLNFFSFL